MPKSTPGIDDLVEALMVSAGHINLLLHHMSQVQQSVGSDDADPPLIVLRGLLRGTLAPLSDRYSYDALRAATLIVNRCTATIEREIVLVPREAFEEAEE